MDGLVYALATETKTLPCSKYYLPVHFQGDKFCKTAYDFLAIRQAMSCTIGTHQLTFRRYAIFLALFLTLNYSMVSADADELLPDLTADEIIEHCWAISEELRSQPNTEAIRAGHLDTALCLETAIVDYASDFIDPDSLSRDDIANKMEQTRFAIGGLYWSLYNEHQGCPFPSCGTIFYSFHNNMVSVIYEEILRRVMAQREDYRGKF